VAHGPDFHLVLSENPVKCRAFCYKTSCGSGAKIIFPQFDIIIIPFVYHFLDAESN